ncbi:MAG: hypothetical protein P0Y50_03175 [Candidatus Brevundimonas colombiensis]|jgi:uncharacterized protein YcfJ|uniref:17 kDa surface antigen n=1 Tax=Candidatus Brevundimonas colombiensis TaxID=3121376 RepID=A0AAJ6BM13_9CAUL|nr:hypothetical protein [Brevundimonas sp.]WEK40624.1 MAG: hypothetical protein P0Y50_03175 [Brevundimonas sp.]
MSKLLKITAVVAAPVVAMTLMAAPASAQSRDRDNTGRNALIGAAVGGLAGAIYGNGDGNYIAGGALAGAAVGAVASNRGSSCGYYRGGQCYRNQGHWEREHGIDSNRYGYDYRYDGRRYDSRYDRRDYRQDDRRDYRYDRRW